MHVALLTCKLFLMFALRLTINRMLALLSFTRFAVEENEEQHNCIVCPTVTLERDLENAGVLLLQLALVRRVRASAQFRQCNGGSRKLQRSAGTAHPRRQVFAWRFYA
jgi:hypothetical protein